MKQWEALLDAIDWADQQQPVRRNTKEACLAKQARLLAGLNETRPREE